MRVRNKFIIITLFVAAVPLVMSASQSIRVHERTLNDILVQLHGTAAELGAQAIEQRLDHTKAALRNVVQDTIDWDALTIDEKRAALQLVLSQIPDALVVTLEHHNGEFVHSTQPSPGERVPLSEGDVLELRQVLPPTETQVAIGTPIRLRNGNSLLPLSVSDHSADGRLSATVGIGLSLEELCGSLRRANPARGSTRLLDTHNRVLCDDGRPSLSFVAQPSLVDALALGRKSYTRQSDGAEVSGAVSLAFDQFRVVVEQPTAVIAAPTRMLRGQVALWLVLGTVAAVVSGFILGRSILEPLERLAAAAGRIGAGVFGEKIPNTNFDAEFAALATSFNDMSLAISERDREIQGWNRELLTRVEERSRELEAAQDALLSSRKMAGLSVTTAGVAHELNNPLTGVLGLAQVLAARLQRRGEGGEEIEILASIVGESKRMQALLERMKVLHGDAEHGSYREVSCAHLLEGALIVRKREFEQLQITVTCKRSEPPIFVWGHFERLHMVFVELIENSYRALREFHSPGDGTLLVDARAINDDWIEIAIEDNGPGIPPSDQARVFEPFFTTKPGGVGQGLGLAQVYRMVEAHSGRVWFDGKTSQGCRVIVRLPRARIGAHLA